MKRFEKSMKDIVNVERFVRDDIDEYLGDGCGNDRNKFVRFCECDGFDSGKEKLFCDVSYILCVNFGEKYGVKEVNLKCIEKDIVEYKVGGFMKLKFKVGGIIYIIVLDFVKKVDGIVVFFVVNFVYKL